MTMNKTPIDNVRAEYGDKDARGKDKLVDKVMGLLSGGDEDAGDLKARLLKVSNRKLLRLARVGDTIKEKYGSTDKVVEAVAGAMGRAKDTDFVTRLKEYSPAKLLDMAQTASRKAARTAREAKGEAEGAVAKVAKAARTTARAAVAKVTTRARATVKAATGKAPAKAKGSTPAKPAAKTKKK